MAKPRRAPERPMHHSEAEREKEISMESCMRCHREHNASNACNYCHEGH